MDEFELTIRLVSFVAVALPAAAAIGALIAKILWWRRIEKWRG